MQELKLADTSHSTSQFLTRPQYDLVPTLMAVSIRAVGVAVLGAAGVPVWAAAEGRDAAAAVLHHQVRVALPLLPPHLAFVVATMALMFWIALTISLRIKVYRGIK